MRSERTQGTTDMVTKWRLTVARCSNLEPNIGKYEINLQFFSSSNFDLLMRLIHCQIK